MKPKLASKKVPLTIKYRVGEHLDNLEARFGANKIRNMGGHLEDLTSPDDADLKPILQFRELIKRREMWLVIAAIMLMVISVTLAMLGGACWIAFSIWKAVFGFFM